MIWTRACIVRTTERWLCVCVWKSGAGFQWAWWVRDRFMLKARRWEKVLPVHTFGARTAAIHLGGVQLRVTADVSPRLYARPHVRVSQCVRGCVRCGPPSLWTHPGKGLIWTVKTILKNSCLAIQFVLLSFFFSPHSLSFSPSIHPSTPSSFTGRIVKRCVCSIPLTCVMRAIKTQWGR